MKRDPITRRTLLKSGAAVLALPSLEIMASDPGKADAAALPPRFAFFYVPFGVNTATWFPVATGADHDFSPTLEPLRPFRSDLTILGGLHHHQPGISNHFTVDNFLTGTSTSKGFNTQSFDQLLADKIGKKNYLKSLVLSTAGGIGSPGRSRTLSFNRAGAPLAADKSPRAVFDKLFPPAEQADRDALGQRLLQRTSILDGLLDQTQAFMRPLGQTDRDKMNEYLTSIRDVERAIQVREEQIRRGPPAGDTTALALEASPSNNMEQRRAYVRCMFDLIHLGFVADTTRVATYAIEDEGSGGGIVNWSDLCGNRTEWHATAHRRGDPEKDGAKQTQIDTWLVEQFAYLVGRLKSTREGDGTLLDRCMLMYGSGNSRTHLHRNLPLVLAGGNAFHLRHGQYLTYVVRNRLEAAVEGSGEASRGGGYKVQEEGSARFANLFVTMARQAGIDIPGFADSDGVLSELVA